MYANCNCDAEKIKNDVWIRGHFSSCWSPISLIIVGFMDITSLITVSFFPHVDRNMSEGKKLGNGLVEQDEDINKSLTEKVKWCIQSFFMVKDDLIHFQ